MQSQKLPLAQKQLLNCFTKKNVDELKHYIYKVLCRYTPSKQCLGEFEMKQNRIKMHTVHYFFENRYSVVCLVDPVDFSTRAALIAKQTYTTEGERSVITQYLLLS